AKPLHRYAAAIDGIVGLSVNRKRGLVTKINLIGLATRPVCATSLAVIQDRPLHTRTRVVATHIDLRCQKRGRQQALPRTAARCRGPFGPSMDRPLSSSFMLGNAASSRTRAMPAETPELTPPACAK